MSSIIARFGDRFRNRVQPRQPTPSSKPSRRIRLHVPQTLLHEIQKALSPTKNRVEPLALLRVRYASESARDVVVATSFLAFPDEAYVDGPAGANFDTRWLVHTTNAGVPQNAGVLLIHSHGGRGKPGFSSTDQRTNRDIMAPLAIGVATIPYGALVLSDDTGMAVVTVDGRLVEADLIAVPDRLAVTST